MSIMAESVAAVRQASCWSSSGSFHLVHKGEKWGGSRRELKRNPSQTVHRLETRHSNMCAYGDILIPTLTERKGNSHEEMGQLGWVTNGT